MRIMETHRRTKDHEEIIKGAEKLVDLLLCQDSDDEVDFGAPIDGSQKRKTPTKNLPSAAKRPRHDAAQRNEGRSSLDSGVGSAPLAQPESSRVTPGSSPSSAGPVANPLSDLELLRCDSLSDEVDGIPSDLTFDKKPTEEKEEIISEIAEKLKKIGDTIEFEKAGSPSLTSVSVSLASDAVERLASNLTYDNFKDAVSKAIGDENGLLQLVFAWRMASAVATKIGNTTAVRGCYLSYITNNLSGWVEQNGGWGGVLRLL